MFTNKWKYLRKQKRKNAKNAMSLFILILLYVLLSIYRSDLKPTGKLISPLPESPIKVKAVMAKETAYKIRSWDENAKLIIDTFKDLGKEDTLIALRVFYCESKLEEKAVNNYEPDGTNSRGIAMINSIHNLPDTIRLDARRAVEWAKAKVIRDGGWGAWTCANYL